MGTKPPVSARITNVTCGEDRSAPLMDRFLSRAQVSELTGLSTTTIWREIRAGRFPKAVSLSPNRKGFRAQDIADWMRSRGAAP